MWWGKNSYWLSVIGYWLLVIGEFQAEMEKGRNLFSFVVLPFGLFR